MFYRTEKYRHGLKYDPFKSLVAPRPIGWISTIGRDGVPNLAPYSFFNAVSDKPYMVMFASDGMKDSQRNAEETGEFVCNLVSIDQRDAMNASAATTAPDINEFALAGLEPEPSVTVRPPRVKGAPAHLECIYMQTVQLVSPRSGDHKFDMIIGEVVGINIDDRFLHDEMVDTAGMRLLSRMGYDQYAVTEQSFAMKRPD